MAEVICLSSDDEEEEFIFTGVNLVEENSRDVKTEAIQSVLVENLVEDEVEPAGDEEDPLATIGANVEHEEPQGYVESNIVDLPENSPDDVLHASEDSGGHPERDFTAADLNVEPVDTFGNEEPSLQNLVGGDLRNEDTIGFSDGVSICENEPPAHLKKSSQLKLLLAEQLAKALTQSSKIGQQGVVKSQDKGGTSRSSGSDFEQANVELKTAVKDSKSGRQGRYYKKIFETNCENFLIPSEKFNPVTSFGDDSTTNGSNLQVDLNIRSENEGLLQRINSHKLDFCNLEENQNKLNHNTAKETTEPYKNSQIKKRAKRRPAVKKRKESISLEAATSSNLVEQESLLYFQQQRMMYLESNKLNLNLTSTSTVENVILQVSQGHFSESEYNNKFQNKPIENGVKRFGSQDNSHISPTKRCKNYAVRTKNNTNNNSDKNANSLLNFKNAYNNQLNVETSLGNIVSTLIDQTLTQCEDTVKKCDARCSKKSIILNKYNSSPSRRDMSPCAPQQRTLKLPNEREMRVFENTSSKPDQNSHSPNNQDNLNKLRFTFDRSRGKENVSVSIVSPSQVSPGTETRYPVSVEGIQQNTHQQSTKESLIEPQLRTSPDIANNHGNPESAPPEKDDLDFETTDKLFFNKSHFIECYRMVYGNIENSLSNEMGRMLLVVLKAQLAMGRYHNIETGNATSAQNSDIMYENAKHVYVQMFNEVKLKFHGLFQQLCIKIFSVPHKEQYKWLFLAWFAKVFLYISNECDDFAESIHEIKAIVLNFLPKMFKLHQLSILQFFQVTDDEFDANFYSIIALMCECVENEDYGLLNNVIKEENSDDIVLTNDTCTAGSIGGSQNNGSDSSQRAVVSSKDKELNLESELNPTIKVEHPDVQVSSLESCTASSIGDSQSNNIGVSLNAPILCEELNKPCKNSDNEVTSLIQKLSKTNCLYVSVIKNSNGISQPHTEEITHEFQPDANQQSQIISNSDLGTNKSKKLLTSSALNDHERNLLEKRRPIMVKSPLTINRDHDKSHDNSALPTFRESFIHPASSEMIRLKNKYLNPPVNKQNTISQNPIHDNCQVPNSVQSNVVPINSDPWNSQSSNYHRATHYQSEKCSPVEIPPPSSAKSTNNTQPSQPFQYQTNYDPNYRNNFQSNVPVRQNQTNISSQNSSHISQTPLIGGNVEYPTTNQRDLYNHPGQNQIPFSNPKEVNAQIIHWMPAENNHQHQQYYLAGTSQTVNPASDYSHLSQQKTNLQQTLTSGNIQSDWRQQQYIALRKQQLYWYHYLTQMQGQPNSYLSHADTPVATAGSHNAFINPYKQPPPYQYPHQTQQYNTRTSNQGYLGRSMDGHSQNSNPKLHDSPSTNQKPANLANPYIVPNKAVLDVPVDTNVTINNFNITAYVPTQNYNQLQSQTKPPS